MSTIASLLVRISAETSEFQSAMANSVKATQDMRARSEEAARAVTLLEDRIKSLKQAEAIGAISHQQFAQELGTVRADAAELATQTDLTAGGMSRLSRVAGTAERSIMGIERSGLGAERGLQRMEFAMFAAMQAGDLTSGSLRGLAMGATRLVGGMGGLAGSFLPVVGIGITVYETIHHINAELEEQQKRADASAESWRKWLSEHAKPIGVARIENPRETLRLQQQTLEAEERRARSLQRQADLVGATTGRLDDTGFHEVTHSGDRDQLQHQADAARELAAALRIAVSEGDKYLAQQERQAYLNAADRMADEIASLHGLTAAQREQVELERLITREHLSPARAKALRDELRGLQDETAEMRMQETILAASRESAQMHKKRFRDVTPTTKEQMADPVAEKTKVALREAEDAHRATVARVREAWDTGFAEVFRKGRLDWQSFANDILSTMLSMFAKMTADQAFRMIFMSGGGGGALGHGAIGGPIAGEGPVGGGGIVTDRMGVSVTNNFHGADMSRPDVIAPAVQAAVLRGMRYSGGFRSSMRGAR